MNYIPLRVKTSYSLLTSLNEIKKIISFCKEKDIKALCITDNNMFGVMEFYKECNLNNIKPVIGIELSINNKIILLYAKNYKGYQNLTRLVFIMQNEVLTYEHLKKYNNDIVCVTNDFNNLKYIYKDIYYGYTNIKDKDNTKKCVYINEILCEKKEDIKYLKYLYMIKNSKTENDDISYEIKDNCYFDLLDYDYINAKEIVDMCNISFNKNINLMPKYNIDNSKEYLFNLCKKGLYKRLDGKVSKRYYDRLIYELNVIDKMNFNDYFLVVWDYVKFAKKNDILIGSGRGSASGSLVSYSLGITDVDPVKYNLLFERFLNIERTTMPDIDIDFDSDRREEVVDYIINKYGEKRCVPIITFSTLKAKSVIRDIGRILNINTNEIDKITKLIPVNGSIKDILNNTYIKNLIKEDKKIHKLFIISLKLEGLKRQISIHAAGIIISPVDLDSYIPLLKYDNNYICAYEKDYIEDIGLVKMDLLGLKNLTLINNILTNINKNENKDIKFKDIKVDDINAINIIKNAYTLGIFQFESIGMRNFLLKLKPNNIEDIFSAIALFRPGPLSNIDSFIKRKEGLEKIDYIHKDLEKVLSNTYGIIVYQEQIMEISSILAGYSYSKSDILRRAMSKKKKEIMLSMKEDFINKSIERGYTEEVSNKTYDYILKFSEYGFNKAHSVAYSFIALKMSYIKYYYKEYFMAELLNTQIGNADKIKEYIKECKKMNINILMPDINLSENEFIKEYNALRVPLTIIKNVTSIISKNIIDERKENGLYKDFYDFIRRVYGNNINKKIIENLIDSGCFDSFNETRKTLHYNLDNAINYALVLKDLDESFVDRPIMNKESEFDKEELSKREREVFGFYLSNHPVLKYKSLYENIVNLNEIEQYFDKRVHVIVYINNKREIITKNNENMCFISGSDDTKDIDITIFPNKFDLIKDIERNDIVLISGRLEKRMSKYQIILEQIKKL